MTTLPKLKEDNADPLKKYLDIGSTLPVVSNESVFDIYIVAILKTSLPTMYLPIFDKIKKYWEFADNVPFKISFISTSILYSVVTPYNHSTYYYNELLNSGRPTSGEHLILDDWKVSGLVPRLDFGCIR